jgi:nucleoside-triphosphatase THEP1
MPLGEVLLDRPQERVRKRTVDTYLISALRRGTSARLASDGRSHAKIGRWDVLVDIPQPVDELSDVERNAAAGLTPDDIDLDLTT